MPSAGRRLPSYPSQPAQRVNELLARVEKLQEAVKYAREEANNIEADEQKMGERVLGYIFA